MKNMSRRTFLRGLGLAPVAGAAVLAASAMGGEAKKREEPSIVIKKGGDARMDGVLLEMSADTQIVVEDGGHLMITNTVIKQPHGGGGDAISLSPQA